MKFFNFFILSLLSYSSVVLASEWDLVYLASFPRSGNHWVRFLIEEVTHIATSSVYKDSDYPHLPSLFPWGTYSTDHGYSGNCRYPSMQDPVVVKTHYPLFKKAIQPIQRVAICLIRHPIDAFYSFHVYRSASKESQKIPDEVLSEFIQKWRKFYQFWEEQPRVIFIRYEDLYENPIYYLTKIIEAIGYQCHPEDIRRAVEKYPPTGGILKSINHYTPENIELIKIQLKDILNKHEYEL